MASDIVSRQALDVVPPHGESAADLWRELPLSDPPYFNVFRSNAERLFAFDYRRSFPVRSRFHSHPNLELFYFHEGAGRYLIGGNVYVLSPGDLLIMHGMTLHCPRMTDGEPFVRTVIHLDPHYPDRATGLLKVGDLLRPYRDFHNARVHLNGRVREEAERMLVELDAISKAKTEHAEDRMRLRLLDLLAFVSDQFSSGGADIARYPSEPEIHSQHALSYIEEHYRDDFSLDDIADAVGVTRSYIARVFHRTTGITIFRYRMERRLNEAKIRFLLFPDTPITDIAFDVGFKQVSHFSRAFRDAVGVTPATYRHALVKYTHR